MGRLREESARPVLRDHGRRPAAARTRDRRVAADVVDHRSVPGSPQRSDWGRRVMSRRSVLAARIRALFFRRRLERELDDEIRFHLEMQAEDNERAGMDAREAALAARRKFGGTAAMKETY